MLKNCIENAASWLNLKIPGEGQKTFKKRFMAGIMVTEPLLLYTGEGQPLTVEDIEKRPLFVPSDGRKGGTTRVLRNFPCIPQWCTTGEMYIFDDKISEKILMRHLDAAGKFVGFGAMRVQNGGINGRFTFCDLKITEVEE